MEGCSNPMHSRLFRSGGDPSTETTVSLWISVRYNFATVSRKKIARTVCSPKMLYFREAPMLNVSHDVTHSQVLMRLQSGSCRESRGQSSLMPHSIRSNTT